MSYASAIDSISRILVLQQQVEDPELAAGGTSATGAGGTSSSSGTTLSATDSAFAAELEEALADADEGDDSAGSELTSLTSGNALLGSNNSLSALLNLLESAESGSSTSATGTADSVATTASAGTSATAGSASARVQAMVKEAESLIGKPYVWGGGHSGWGTQSGYDCSGFVSAVLHAGGYLSSPEDTQTLPAAAGIESGAGKYVTIYDRTDAGSGDDHVIIEINGQFYESGGEHSSWGGGGGVEKISTPSAAYLSSFNDILHPAGL